MLVKLMAMMVMIITTTAEAFVMGTPRYLYVEIEQVSDCHVNSNILVCRN